MHNQVVVSTKSPRSDKQYIWESAADSSSYIIKEETDPEKLLRRGTQITLYLRVFCHFIYFLIGRVTIIVPDVYAYVVWGNVFCSFNLFMSGSFI